MAWILNAPRGAGKTTLASEASYATVDDVLTAVAFFGIDGNPQIDSVESRAANWRKTDLSRVRCLRFGRGDEFRQIRTASVFFEVLSEDEDAGVLEVLGQECWMAIGSVDSGSNLILTPTEAVAEVAEFVKNSEGWRLFVKRFENGRSNGRSNGPIWSIAAAREGSDPRIVEFGPVFVAYPHNADPVITWTGCPLLLLEGYLPAVRPVFAATWRAADALDDGSSDPWTFQTLREAIRRRNELLRTVAFRDEPRSVILASVLAELSSETTAADFDSFLTLASTWKAIGNEVSGALRDSVEDLRAQCQLVEVLRTRLDCTALVREPGLRIVKDSFTLPTVDGRVVTRTFDSYFFYRRFQGMCWFDSVNQDVVSAGGSALKGGYSSKFLDMLSICSRSDGVLLRTATPETESLFGNENVEGYTTGRLVGLPDFENTFDSYEALRTAELSVTARSFHNRAVEIPWIVRPGDGSIVICDPTRVTVKPGVSRAASVPAIQVDPGHDEILSRMTLDFRW